MKSVLTAMLSLALMAPVYALQTGQGEFVPANTVSTEPFPAAPLLIAAYGFAWVAVFFFVWSVWRRLGKVETDMQVLERRRAERGGAR